MPPRSISNATISFGLVSVPVNLYSSAESKSSISFNMLHKKCGTRLKQQYVCPKDGEVVSRDEIMDGVWGDDTYPSTRTIDNFIVRLRRLFEPDPSAPVHFHTVWGVGYRFTPEPVADGQPLNGA